MNETSSDKVNHVTTLRGWLIRKTVCGIVGLCLGILSAIALGRLMLFTDFPEPMQYILERFYNSPRDLSGAYYYVTTPQNIAYLPVECDGEPNAKTIAGSAKIRHVRRIAKQDISIDGDRIYCISPENKIVKLKRIKWRSNWAFIHDGKLYTKLAIDDDKEGYIEGSSIFDKEDGFSAKTVYVWQVENPQRKKDLGWVNIEFFKCKTQNCEGELVSKLSDYGGKQAHSMADAR